MVDEPQSIGEQEAESPLDDYQSMDLDINSLIQKFVRPIDRYRSYNAPIIAGLLDQPGLSTSNKLQESRAHAFYRMLGLPAIEPTGKFFNPGFNPLLDGDEKTRRADIAAAIPTAIKTFVQHRENESRRKYALFSRANMESSIFTISMSFPKAQKPFAIALGVESFKSLTQPDPQSFPIPLRKSLIQERYKKKDGSDITGYFNDTVFHPLAPFMTDPVIAANVDPKSGDQSRLIGAPFLEKEDLEFERNRYAKRPGLEFILRLRLRQQNIAEQTGVAIDNVDLTTLEGDISVDRQRDIAAALSDSGVANVDVKQVLEGSGRVELYTLNDLVKTYKGLIHLYVKNIENLERIYPQIIWVPLSNEGGPEQGTEVSTWFVIPKRRLNSWELEQRISQLSAKSTIAKMQFEIGETADETPLAYSDFTISEFQNLSKVFESQLQETKNERDRLEADASNALRAIEFISGEVSGLGLVDIMAIYMALWSLDVSVLLDLIDDGAAERLNQITELRTAGTRSRANRQGNAKEAYEKLAERIHTILSYGDRLYQRELGSPVEEEGGDIVRDTPS